jgi:nicotinamide-nucleotide amidase
LATCDNSGNAGLTNVSYLHSGATEKLSCLNIELINTGTELMLGFVTNTHQQWICRELSAHGYLVDRQIAVCDRARVIQEAVRESLTRAELVITTGGLGPTSDDLTRQAIAELFNCTLHEDAQVVAKIEEFFQGRKRPMPVQTRVQALVPDGAIVLQNRIGTAPGLALEIDRARWSGVSAAKPGLLIMLPGPPRELVPMFQEQVIPLLAEKLPPPSAFVCHTLKSTGIGESIVEEKIAGPLQTWVDAGLQIGYCARFGEVDIRLSAQGLEAQRLVREAEAVVLTLLGKNVFGSGSDPLELVVVRELTMRGQTVGLAESCTGGYVANRITNVPGSSAVFAGGLVTYGNEAKQQLLGVPKTILDQHGAVSEAVARSMAEGARDRLHTTYALAITGIAGPTGGTPAKPVGTVYLALAGPEPTIVLHLVNRYDRESFKFVTSQQALDLLRRNMMGSAQ